MKTHSGAKKRMRVLKSGKVKRKQTKMRHLNSHMSSKTKRHLGQVVFVNEYNLSNENEIKINQDLSKGVYSILVNSGDRKIVNKLIVQ